MDVTASLTESLYNPYGIEFDISKVKENINNFDIKEIEQNISTITAIADELLQEQSPTLPVLNGKNLEIQSFANKNFPIRYNQLKQKYEIYFRGKVHFINDAIWNSVWNAIISNNFNIPYNNTAHILLTADLPEYNPFDEYMQNAPYWNNGTDYISQISALIPIVEEQQERFNDYFKKWFCLYYQQISGLYDNTNPYLMILASKSQGIGKSQFTRRLIPSDLRGNYFKSISVDSKFPSKDNVIAVAEHILIELSELGNITKACQSRLKSFIDITQINERRPYGHFDSYAKRRASFFGSSNESKILSDASGSRRYWIFEVTENVKIEFEKLTDELLLNAFSQAKYLSMTNKPSFFHLTPEQVDAHNNHNLQFHQETIENEKVMYYFTACKKEDNGADVMTTTEILDYMNEKLFNKDYFKNTQITLNKIADALSSNNFVKGSKRRNGSKYPVKGWLVKKIDTCYPAEKSDW